MSIMDILNDVDSIKISISLAIGAFLSIVCQLIYEQFFNDKIYRYIFMAASLLIAFLYYLVIRNSIWDIETAARTMVICFILTVLLIWIPSVKSRINFNQSFLAVFKCFFMAVFLNGVLFVGVAIILAAVNLLLVEINEKAYLHAANIIFVFLSPMSFLLYFPVFAAAESSGKKTPDDGGNLKTDAGNVSDNDEKLYRSINCGKFLETLVSYVIIPVAAVFTLILVIYILINITGSFWTDNLLESMLVAYSITVILIYLLASNIDNAWSKSFRNIFPKVLVVVVLFQTVSSLIRISKYGVTYGRYYVIMFGIFATIAGIIFSVMPKEKNGVIAPILLVLSVISILPGVDAFTISRINQINRLKTVLIRNDMFSDEKVIPNSNISDDDKKIIISSFSYLNHMNYLKDISWLSEYNEHYNFEKIFGFSIYEDGNKGFNFISINRERSEGIELDGYDYLAVFDVYNADGDRIAAEFVRDGISYGLHLVNIEGKDWLILQENRTEILRFAIEDIFARFAADVESGFKSTNEVSFISENEKASMRIIIDYFSFNTFDTADYNGQLYVLIKIK